MEDGGGQKKQGGKKEGRAQKKSEEVVQMQWQVINDWVRAGGSRMRMGWSWSGLWMTSYFYFVGLASQ